MSFSDISLIISSTFIISCSILSFGLSCYTVYKKTSLEIIKSRNKLIENYEISEDEDVDDIYVLQSISSDSFETTTDYNYVEYNGVDLDEYIEISLDFSQSNETHDSEDYTTDVLESEETDIKYNIERVEEGIKILYTNQINLEKFISERVNYLDSECKDLVNFIHISNSENHSNLSKYTNILQHIKNLSSAC